MRNGYPTLVVLSFVAACAPRPAPPPAPSASAPVPPSLPSVSRWRPVQVPPSLSRKSEKSATFTVPGGTLVFDESGGRWLLPKEDEPPKSAELIDTVRATARFYDDARGLLVLTADDELWGTKDPLGPLTRIAKLPLGTEPESVRFFRGGLTLHVSGGVQRASGEGFLPVHELSGYTAGDILMAPSGAGVGLFLPETVAITKDFGATWTPVSLPGARAASLEAHGDLALALPGGLKDGFARAVDVDSGQISRQHVEPKAPRQRERSMRSVLIDPMDLDDLPGTPAAPDKALKEEGQRFFPGGERGDGVVSGDAVLVGAGQVSRGLASAPVVFKGPLGGALLPLHDEGLEHCTVRSAALCGELAAVACQDRVLVFRGDAKVATYALPNYSRLVFDADSRLLSVTLNNATRKLDLVVYDLASAEAPPPTEIAGFDGTPPTLVGGCGKPALWLVNAGNAARWERSTFGSSGEFPPGALPLAVTYTGALLTSNGRELSLFPDDVPVPAPPAGPGFVSLAEDGRHGLLVAPSGQAWQTDDGARTFSPIETPTTKVPQRVVCGKTRCQLGSGAVREGFLRSSELVSAWPEPPPKTTAAAGALAKEAPMVMTCTSDGSLFKDAATGMLSPRLGALLYTGLDDLGNGKANAIFGAPAGGFRRVALPRNAGQSGGPEESFFVNQVVGKTRNVWRDGVSSTTSFRWTPDGPLQTLSLTESSPLPGANLLAEDGVAGRLYSQGELLLVSGGKVERRSYPSRLRFDEPGTLSVDEKGRWLVAEGGGASAIRLVVLEKETSARYREISVRRGEPAETGGGFLAGTSLRLVLLEELPDGGTELRIRPVLDDLSLGPQIGPALASAPRGHLLALPSCGSPATGSLVRLASSAKVFVQADDTKLSGTIERLVRATETAACVERTVLVGSGDSPAELVVAGNGGIAAAIHAETGLRCGPLVTTPPDKAPLPLARDVGTAPRPPRKGDR